MTTVYLCRFEVPKGTCLDEIEQVLLDKGLIVDFDMLEIYEGTDEEMEEDENDDRN